MRTSERTATVASSHLSADALRRLRRLLLADAGVQAAQLAGHRSAERQLRDLTDADSVLERELAEAGAARAEEAMAEIEHALQRLDASMYGWCEACGVSIPFERLEAIPAARFCVACPRRLPVGRGIGAAREGLTNCPPPAGR